MAHRQTRRRGRCADCRSGPCARSQPDSRARDGDRRSSLPCSRRARRVRPRLHPARAAGRRARRAVPPAARGVGPGAACQEADRDRAHGRRPRHRSRRRGQHVHRCLGACNRSRYFSDRARARMDRRGVAHLRARAQHPGSAGLGRIQRRSELVGPISRLACVRRRTRDTSAGPLHVDQIRGGSGRDRGGRGDRMAERRAGRDQRNRDAARRSDRFPGDDRGGARRRPYRRGRRPPCRTDGARDDRGAGRARAPQRAPGSRDDGDSDRSPAFETASLDGICPYRRQRPVVLAGAIGDRCIRSECAAARHGHGPHEAR